MANRVKLEAEKRTETGKGAARSLRRDGYVPGVVYGHGDETESLKVEAKELEKLLLSISYENTVIDLAYDDVSKPVLIREVQIHPYRPEVLHVDFLTVRKGEKVRVEVPIRLVGEAPGVEEGGIMEHARHEVELRCDPDVIPEALELDVSGMNVGDTLTVGDLVVPAGVEILEDADATVCSIVPPTKIEEPEPAVEVAELEEIGVEVEGEEAPEAEAEAAEAEEGEEGTEAETSEGERQP